MSLKAIHILFITASTLLAFGFGVWELKQFFSPEGARIDIYLGIASFVAGIALVIYGRYFLKKLKNIGFL